MAVIWLLLNIMDMVITVVMVRMGFIEALPVARSLLSWTPVSFILFKITAPLAVLLAIYAFKNFRLLQTLNMLLGVVVLWDTLLFLVSVLL